MALIKCPECGKEVSSTAQKCINCGFILNKPKRSITGKIFKGLFVGFNAIMGLIILFTIFGIVGAPESATASSKAIVGSVGTGVIIITWVFIGLPLGIMSYITRSKEI